MIDLLGRSDVPVAEEVLAELASLCDAMGVEFIVIGAAARDLVIHALQKSVPSSRIARSASARTICWMSPACGRPTRHQFVCACREGPSSAWRVLLHRPRSRSWHGGIDIS